MDIEGDSTGIGRALLAGIVLLAAGVLVMLPAATALVTASEPHASIRAYELLGGTAAPFAVGLPLLKGVTTLLAAAYSHTNPTPSS